MKKILLIGFIFVAASSLVWAQVPTDFERGRRFVDPDMPNTLPDGPRPDSVKRNKDGKLLLERVPPQVYSLKTAGYVLESDWFENRETVRLTDSTLLFLHRYNFVARNEFQYQDLGTLGTAMRPLFYWQPEGFGIQQGMRVLEPYLIENSQVNYRDTKSPYSRWYYAQGGSGRTVLDVTFSQNINPQWNVSLEMRRLGSRLLVGNEPGGRNDRQADHETYLASTRYASKNGRYRLLATANHFRHSMAETGGIQLDSVGGGVADSTLLDSFVPPLGFEREPGDLESIEELFELPTGSLENRLTRAQGDNRRNQWHLYHEYAIAAPKYVQVFHSFSKSTHTFKFNDRSFKANAEGDFYRQILLTTDQAAVSTYAHRLQVLENQVGVKGSIYKLFYAFVGGRRDYRFRYEYLAGSRVPRALDAQTFVGFTGIYDLTKDIYFKGEYRGLIGDAVGGNRVYAELNTKYLVATHKRVTSQPNLMQTFYYGNHFRWNNQEGSGNEFLNQEFAETEVKADLGIRGFSFRPFAKLVSYRNYIYFNQLAEPDQAEGTTEFLQVGTRAHVNTGKVHYDLMGIYTQNDDETVLRMPKLFGNLAIYFQGDLFKKAMFVQMGADFHWHSEFFADAYMPITQQFFLQDDVRVGGYLQSEVFLNFTMKKVNMFVKVPNVLQGFVGSGYYTTPLYMGQPRQFEFGVTWLFFD